MTLWNETKTVTLACGASVTLRHIGSVDAPLLWDDLHSTWTAALEAARLAARKRMRAEHGSMQAALEAAQQDMREDGVAADVVDALTVPRLLDRETQREYRDAFNAYVKACVVNGVAFDGKSGDDAYHALFTAHGPRGLTEAWTAVLAFHRVDASTGEG